MASKGLSLQRIPAYVLTRNSLLIRVALVLGCCALVAQATDVNLDVGFVSLTTTQTSNRKDAEEHFAPNLLVRFEKAAGGQHVIAMTDQTGTAIVPLEPGEYCVSAFGLDGQPALLSDRSLQPEHRCIRINSGTTLEFGVTLASTVTYSRSLPPVSVQ